MKRTLNILAILGLLLQPAFSFNPSVVIASSPAAPLGQAGDQPVSVASMPGRPTPNQPIPHHEPGQPARLGEAATYQVNLLNAEGQSEAIELTGLDAMLANGTMSDPLQGNYRLVDLDKVMFSSYAFGSPNTFTVNTYAGTALSPITGSGQNFGNYRFNAIAAGDLSGDLVDEQIAAWVDPATQHIKLQVRELPGALGQSTTAPAVVAHPNGELDVLVRGYDDALWHLHFDGTNWGSWNTAGGILLSSPAAVSRAAGELDVFALGMDNQVYHTQWISPTWSAWIQVDCGDDFPTIGLSFPLTSIPSPALVARDGGQLDLFRRGPDNTLRWCHSDNGETWGSWQNLGGMLASEPGAVALGDGRMQVYAHGADNALWYRTFYSGWGDWQRLETPAEVAAEAVPVLTSPATGQVTVYLAGAAEQVWSIQNNGSGWEDWSSIPVDYVGGEPDVKFSADFGVGSTPGGTYLFARMSDGSLQYHLNDTWNALPGLDITVEFDTGNQTRGLFDDLTIENFVFDMTTGYFSGDGRQQLVLAYDEADNSLRLEVYDLQDGFILSKRAELTAHISSASWPRVAAGDVDGDGVDEIGLLYKADTDGIKMRVYQIEKDAAGQWTGSLSQLSGEESFTPAPFDDGFPTGLHYWEYGGTLRIAAGNIATDTGSPDDEFVVVSDWTQDADLFLYHSYRSLVIVHLYDYQAATKFSRQSALDSFIDANTAPDGYNAHATGVGLAVGNVDPRNGNYDEVIITWPHDLFEEVYPRVRRYLRVYQYDPENSTLEKEVEDVDLDPFVYLVLASYSKYTFLDTLAVGDLDQDLVDEIILAKHIYQNFLGISGDYYALDIYELDGSTIEEVASSSLDYDSPPRAFNFALGDFTAGSTRVGPPTYRAQNRVDSILARLNMPPKHWDMIKKSDGTYQTITIRTEECWTSAKDPKCTHTLHGTIDGQTSTTETETQRDWSIGTEIQIGDKTTFIKNSLDYTYGEHFSRTTTEIEQTEFSSDTTAGYDDAIIYYGNPYRIWEYPILSSNSTEPDGYLTVIFPDVTQSDIPDAKAGAVCEYGWYNPGHQPYNVWSYESIGDIRFSDYTFENYLSDVNYAGSESEFKVYFRDLTGVKTTNAQSHAFKGKLELNFAKWFKAAVKGTYDSKEIETDITQTSEETYFSAYLAGINTADNFTTRAIAYWSTEGPLVIDFQTEPGTGTTWQLYNQPDPAFILPWYGFPAQTPEDLPYDDPNNHGAPPCGPEKQYFSYDITIDPPFASVGETATITATVRNFSILPINQSVAVRFYKGLPGAANTIGSCTIQPFERLDGPQQCTINWVVAGAGEQKIYAVIDPDAQLDEMHDENHVINNNMGYGVLQIGETSYIDEGVNEAYKAIYYAQSTDLAVTLYTPSANLDATTRIDLRDNAVRYPSIAGNPFEIVALQGSVTRDWGTPVENFSLRPAAGDPPAVILINYLSTGITGLDENQLMLYRRDAILGWQPANLDCGVDSLNALLYPVLRLPQDDLLVVPVCKTGLFALSDHQPEDQFGIFLPKVVR